MGNIFIKRHQLGYERWCTVQAMDDFHVRDLEMTPLRSSEVSILFAEHFLRTQCAQESEFCFHALKFLLVSLSNYWSISHRHGAEDRKSCCYRLQQTTD